MLDTTEDGVITVPEVITLLLCISLKCHTCLRINSVDSFALDFTIGDYVHKSSPMHI